MLYPKFKLLVFATWFSFRGLAEPAGVDEPNPGLTPQTATLNAGVRNGEVIGHEQYRRVFMKTLGRQLMLVVPQGYRADVSNPERVTIVNPDFSCVLSFRIAATGSVAVASLNADLCRTWLSARIGDLKIQSEFSVTAANQSGPGFEVYYKADGLSRAAQVAFIPSPVGVLEFTLTSSPENLQAAKSVMQVLLLGFRISDANGHLEVPPVQAES